MYIYSSQIAQDPQAESVMTEVPFLFSLQLHSLLLLGCEDPHHHRRPARPQDAL